MEKNVVSPGAAEGERSSTGAAPEAKRWSSNRKKEVALLASCEAIRLMPFPVN